MTKFLKDVFRPRLFAIVSALCLVSIISVFILPLMKQFPIFYQWQANAEPAYMLKFKTSTTQPTLLLIGGSRFLEMAYSDEHVNAELKAYTNKNFIYVNLATNGLSLVEQLAIIDQSHYLKGSVVLLGVNVRLFAKSSTKSDVALSKQKLNFFDYKVSKQAIKKAGVAFPNIHQPYLYRSRNWLADFLCQFKWKELMSQNWNNLSVPFKRPHMFGFSKKSDLLEDQKMSISEFNKYHLHNRKLLEFIINYAQQEKGYKVYLFQAPGPLETQQLEAPYLAKFHEDLNYLAENTGAQIISANNTILDRNEFHDLMHLNEFGRAHYEATFTQQLADVANNSFSQ